jgi:PPOX class probable F420-dependent enzyme
MPPETGHGVTPDAIARFGSAPVAHLATASADGAPHLVPICFALLGDSLYFAIDEKPKLTRQLKRLRNVRENPRVSVVVDHYEDDWSRLWWVRADGVAREIADTPDVEIALAVLRAKYHQYAIDPPAGPFVRVEIQRWLAWNAAPAGGKSPE